MLYNRDLIARLFLTDFTDLPLEIARKVYGSNKKRIFCTKKLIKKMETIQIGKIYEVNNYRKGKFTIEVTKVNNDFVTGTIIDGKANAMLSYNEREKGETISLRTEFTTFKEIK